MLFVTVALFVTSEPAAGFAGIGGSAAHPRVSEVAKRQVSYRWAFVPMWLVACSLRITSICKPRSILVVRVILRRYTIAHVPVLEQHADEKTKKTRRAAAVQPKKGHKVSRQQRRRARYELAGAAACPARTPETASA